MKDKDTLAIARERFRSCVDAEADNREHWLADLEFYHGDQWPDDIRKAREEDHKPVMTVNKIPAFVRQIVNEIRQIRPSIKVRPVDSQADPETAEVINGMIRAIEQDSSAESAYDWAAEYAVISGVGYWRILTEYESPDTFDQRIVIERVRNPFSVYVDPAAERQDASDARYMFVVERMTREAFEQKYPDVDPTSWTEAAGVGEDREWWWSEDHVRVAEYWCVEEEQTTLYAVQDPMTGQTITTAEEPPEGMWILDQRDTTIRKVTQKLITGAEVLEENEWPGRYIPIVRVLGRELDIEGEIHVQGLVRDLREPQQLYNFNRSVEAERTALSPKAPWVGARGAFKDRKWRQANKVSYAYLEYDPVPGEPAPQRTPPVPIEAGLQAQIQLASQEFQDITGIYPSALGDRSNEVSGVAINNRRSESDVSNFDFGDNLARAMTYAGKVLVDLIPRIYTGARMIRILKPDGQEESVQINAGYIDPQTMKPKQFMLEAGRYDVSVDIGPSYATQRAEAAESMMQFLQAFPQAAQVTGDLLAKNFDWPEADEIAKRLKLLLPPELLADENPQFKQALQQKDQEIQMLQQQMGQMNQMLQQMQVELQNKQGELQIKEREAMTKAQKVINDALADQMSHTEGMTKLELEAMRDLGQQGVAYPPGVY